jgi:hypothetical protein
VDARLLDELRDRRDPSSGARVIGAEMASEISYEIRAQLSALPPNCARRRSRRAGRKRQILA